MPNVSAIRNLFLHPHPTYSLGEAATLLEMDAREVQRWIDVGELAGVECGDGQQLSWPELVSFAMDLWSQELVEEALGAEVAGVLPELVRLTNLEVRIPRLEVAALERVAARDGKSVDHV